MSIQKGVSPKATLCCLFVTRLLKEYINHFTILVNGPLKIILFSIDLNEDLINKESIAVALVFPS